MAHKAIVSEKKKKEVQDFVKLVDKFPVIGIVDVESLPAKQLTDMRTRLRDLATIKMTKKTLMRLIFQHSKKENIEELSNHIKGMPALIFSEDNPFKLFKILKKNKSPAPIKAGQEAPKDIVVNAGPTGFAPGPIIGELGALGIKAGIEGGKVAIKQDKVVAKEGDVVDQKLAAILQRLEIFPGEVGLNLTAVYENGSVLTKSVLDIDEEAFAKDLQRAASDALLLSLEIAYPTKDNVVTLLAKAHRDSLSLASERDILTKETVQGVLAKADAQASALKNKVDN